MKFCSKAAALVLIGAFAVAGCGYHVSGQGDLLPKTIHTICVPAFENLSARYRLTDRLPEAITREFIARTHYQIVSDRNQADAVLRGAVLNFLTFPTVFDQATGRATGLQVNVTMSIQLVERTTGKVLFTRPSFEMKQQYEISIDPHSYFDESETALNRLSRDVARDVVSAILENF